MSRVPGLVYANDKGEIFDHPTLKMAVGSAQYDFLPYETELIKLPKTSRLYFMPHTRPLAYDVDVANLRVFEAGRAVSVFLAPGFLRLFLPAYKKTKDYVMPLYAYTAVGFLDGDFVVPAIQVDDISKWNPANYDFSENFDKQVADFIAKHPKNRLYEQLAVCATKYHCTAAKNIFYPRWECPIPTSPTCNSACVGCISLQTSECCPSPQTRLNFTPTAQEIAQVALIHAETAADPLISFGQGCEGDPVLVADNIAEAIKIIKKARPDLTVNFNSNCSIPENVKKVIDAGADSVRVSINSLVETTYNAYYRPRNYKLADVIKSVEIAKKAGLFVQLNLLTFPGVNDRASETEALLNFIDEYKIDLIQTRNLNIDEELLFSHLSFKPEEIYGLKNMLRMIKKRKPDIKFGYFNRMKSEFGTDRGFPDLKPPKKKKGGDR